MRIELLAWAAGVLAITSCRQTPGGNGTGNALDTIIRSGSAASRDTIIKYRAAGHRDTIIMHAQAVPDSCEKVPPPPGCPPRFLMLKKDTIIK